MIFGIQLPKDFKFLRDAQNIKLINDIKKSASTKNVKIIIYGHSPSCPLRDDYLGPGVFLGYSNISYEKIIDSLSILLPQQRQYDIKNYMALITEDRELDQYGKKCINQIVKGCVAFNLTKEEVSTLLKKFQELYNQSKSEEFCGWRLYFQLVDDNYWALFKETFRERE